MRYLPLDKAGWVKQPAKAGKRAQPQSAASALHKRRKKMDTTQCPKCGNPVTLKQVNNVQFKYCEHCGPLSNGTDVKTKKTIRVKR
jgi:hypothetical protein